MTRTQRIVLLMHGYKPKPAIKFVWSVMSLPDPLSAAMVTAAFERIQASRPKPQVFVYNATWRERTQ